MRLLIGLLVALALLVQPTAAFTPHPVAIHTRVWKVVVQYDKDVYVAFERGAYVCCDAGKLVEVHLGEIEKEDLNHIQVPKVGDRVYVAGMLVRDYAHKLWVLHPIYSIQIER